ncbi:MAG: nucleotidyltransferase [Clostridia bacterium]|nr:nucleotidyltransferase [Clostridia bacterium]
MNGTEKKKISAVICEYNPFHNGHEFMLRKMREDGATHIVACMSGNFTQRGEAAVFDKYTRAGAALSCGADLVMELPVSFACSWAERFAFGGVYLLDALGCVDEIAFGSECGDISKLKTAACAVNDDSMKTVLKQYLDKGMTFAAARQKAVEKIYGQELSEVLSSPNNILGIEYIKALQQIGSKIQPHTILRTGTAHDSTKINGTMTSAGHIRQMITEKKDYTAYIPETAAKLYSETENLPPKEGRMAKLEGAMLYRLRTMNKKEFAELPEVGEGLENRIYEAVRKSTNLNELIDYIKTKRYTHARIRRIIMYASLGFKKNNLQPLPQYMKVLGLNDKGREILKAAKNTAKLSLVMKYADVHSLSDSAKEMYDFESRCDDVYALSGEKTDICGRNCTSPIIIL